MKPQEFIEIQDSKDDFDYGLCPPPTTAEEGMKVLTEHFLGKDWYVTMPLSAEQCYTEAIYAILERNQPKRSWFKRLFNSSK